MLYNTDTQIGWQNGQDVGSLAVRSYVSGLEATQTPKFEQEETLQLIQNTVDKFEKNTKAMRASIERIQQRVADRPRVQRFDWDPTDPVQQHATRPRRHSVRRSSAVSESTPVATNRSDGRSLSRLSELLDRQQETMEKLKRAASALNASKVSYQA